MFNSITMINEPNRAMTSIFNDGVETGKFTNINTEVFKDSIKKLYVVENFRELFSEDAIESFDMNLSNDGLFDVRFNFNKKTAKMNLGTNKYFVGNMRRSIKNLIGNKDNILIYVVNDNLIITYNTLRDGGNIGYVTKPIDVFEIKDDQELTSLIKTYLKEYQL
jgi:hypothetical protein